MAEVGSLDFEEDREGGVLRLRWQEGEQLVLLAGCGRKVQDDIEAGGLIDLFRGNTRLVRLTTAGGLYRGRLKLYGLAPSSGEAQWLLRATVDDGQVAGRSASLTLRAFPVGGGVAEEIARLGSRGAGDLEVDLLRRGELRLSREGELRAHLFVRDRDDDGGQLSLRDSAGEKATVQALGDGGSLVLRDPGGTARVTARVGGPAHPGREQGVVEVTGEAQEGAGVAALEVDDAGPVLRMSHAGRTLRISLQGIEATNKEEFGNDLVAPHPVEPDKEIHYSVVEAPEVGVFVRGTARLSKGAAEVELPDHFSHIASEGRLTAHLTPRASSSKGVAAVELTTARLVIRELAGGLGDYDVDYLVHGVRRGREGFEVVRRRRAAPAEAVARPGGE